MNLITAAALLALLVGALLAGVLLGRAIARSPRREIQRSPGQAYPEELFEGSPEAVVLLDHQGRAVRVNPPFTALFGYLQDAIAGRSIDELIVPSEYRDEARDISRRLLAGEKVSLEAVRQRRDGTLVNVSIVGAPVRRVGGETGAFAIYRDITERKRTDESLRRLEKAVENMQLGVTVTDLDGRIMFTNRAEAAMHGHSVDELLSRDVRVLAAPGAARRMSPEQIEEMKTWRRETVNARRDGSLFPVQLLSDVVRNAAGEPIGIVTTCEDITQRKWAERALWESEERYALSVRGANDGLWDWNLETDEVHYSARWQSMLGYGEGEVGRRPEAWLSRVHADDIARLKADLAAHREDRLPRFENEHRIRHQDGTYRWVLARGIAERDPKGKPYRIAGSLTDITKRKATEEQLAREALYDRLTGLPNRAFLTDLLERSIKRMKRRNEYQFAVLFVDLDRFKVVNDSLGHAAGDQLLVEVGRRLQQCLRPGDVVARLGGDEFCVLVDDLKDSSDTTRVAERIQAALKAPVHIEGREIFVSASIGIAVSETGLIGPEYLLRHADTAMYRAKARGKARFEVFDRAMHERAVQLLQMEADLRGALDTGQFRLAYQPVVALQTRRIAGFEALLRWQHPRRGLVAPAQFVPLAEETGLIVPIGTWVLHEACRQMAAWAVRFPDMPDLSVSVNLSAKQLQHTDLLHAVAEALRSSRLKPGQLKFDITETVLMDDPEFHIAVLHQLSGLGVRVQIDDFGTGASSLTYLNRLPVDTVKIDRSFVSRLGDHRDQSALVQAVVTLARGLGIGVVAEGVETMDQSTQLISLRCDHGQGYLYSHPLDAQAATTLLEDQSRG